MKGQSSTERSRSTASGEVKVNVMCNVGKWWKWPEQEDHIFY